MRAGRRTAEMGGVSSWGLSVSLHRPGASLETDCDGSLVCTGRFGLIGAVVLGMEEVEGESAEAGADMVSPGGTGDGG